MGTAEQRGAGVRDAEITIVGGGAVGCAVADPRGARAVMTGGGTERRAVGAMRGGGRWLGAAAGTAVLICAGCASSPGQQQAAVPTLGRPAGLFAHGEGFGQVRPSKIFNGGDPTGLVSHITWNSWGGTRASGTGTSDYVGPGQSVATGTQQPVTVVAFNRGTCHGRDMYRAVEWYFPAHGGRFNPRRYENICTGAYVPAAP